MKKIFYTALLPWTFCVLLAGCHDDDDVQYLFPEEFHKILYILNDGEQDVTLYNTGSLNDFGLTVCKAGSDPSLTADLRIEVMSQSTVDEMYTDNEGIPYRIVPEGSYTIEPAEIYFANSETSKKVTVAVDPLQVAAAMEDASEETRWILPLQAVSESDSVNSNKDTYILLFDAVVTPPVGFRMPGVQVYNHDFTSGPFSASNVFGLLTVQNSWDVTAALSVEADYVTTYNEQHNTNYQIPAAGTYVLPADVTLTPDVQDASVDISITDFGDAKSGYYMLPLRLSNVSRFELSEEASLWAPVVRLVGHRFDLSTWSIEACSEELAGEGENNGHAIHAIDGDVNTFWNTCWQTGDRCSGLPHWLILDAQTEREFTQVGLRQRNSSTYQVVKDFNVYVSRDKEVWTPVATGLVCETGTIEEQIFDLTPTRGRYLKVEFTSSRNGDGSMCLGELIAYGED